MGISFLHLREREQGQGEGEVLDMAEPTLDVPRVWGVNVRPFAMATLKISKSIKAKGN